MGSPLNMIGRRGRRSPFGTNVQPYKIRPRRNSARAKVVVVAIMVFSAAAAGLFVKTRIAERAGPELADAATLETASAEPIAAQRSEPAKPPPKPSGLSYAKVATPPPLAIHTTEPDELNHNDPRWAGAAEEAAPAPADTAGSEELAFKETDPSPAVDALKNAAANAPRADSDKGLTAAIPPQGQDEADAPADDRPAKADATQGGAGTARISHAVNLRSRPASGSKVIKVIPTGASVGFFGCKSWCEVSYQGSRGFIYKSFLSGGGRAAKARTSVAKPAAAAAPPQAPDRTAPAWRVSPREANAGAKP